MPAFISRYWLAMFVRSRLCRLIALGVFLSILIAEAVILVPSIFNYKRDVLYSLNDSGRAASEAALGVMTDTAPKKVLSMATEKSVLTGAELFDWHGTPMGTFGEPLSEPLGVPPTELHTEQIKLVGTDRAEVLWLVNGFEEPMYIHARLDASNVGPEILAFIGRITLLVLFLSIVVTFATMVVLGATVLKPLLTLHGRMAAAGDDPRHPERHELTPRGSDELGELMAAFNSLIHRVRDNLLAAEDAASKLDEANRGLEQKVSERTRELTDEVDRRRIAEEKVKFDAYHDNVTMLGNRSKLVDELKLGLERKPCSAPGMPGFAVFSVLVDRFKTINDSLGPHSGDKLIQEVAGRINDSLGELGVMARLDAETFGVMMEHVSDRSVAHQAAKRMQSAMDAPIVIDGEEVHMSLSIGIAFSADCVQRAEELLQSAGLALGRARLKGKGSLVFFQDSDRDSARDRLRLENDLRRAIKNGGELEMYYQPVMAISRNGVAGFEALMRWNHPERGLVSPGIFIPIAEESDLIVPMGAWSLIEAARQLAQWQALHGEDLFVSVNVSGRQLYADDLVAVVRDVLDETKINPRTLKLELTETVLMDDPKLAISILNQLRDLGVRLGIDDFGTGYSSLSYLQQLPFDTLKIDRAFVKEMADSEDDQQIVKTIADLGHNLGMELIAEGIERPNEVPLLQRYGCDLTQGFLFARPMPVAEASAFLSAPREAVGA